MIVAGINGFDDLNKYDSQKGGSEAWIAKINRVSLKDLTPHRALDWKQSYLSRAGDNPQKRVHVNRAFNAALRHAKSLFSPRIIDSAGFGLKIPKFTVETQKGICREVFWFSDLSFEKSGSMKFQPPQGVTYQNLIISAKRELLTDDNWEAYVLFLLCLCAGLRRAEADVLLWTQIDPVESAIRIETNQYIQPMHDSGGVVFVDTDLIKEILQFKSESRTQFVVDSPTQWKRTSYPRYRCQKHWSTLNAWLESKGITAIKKIHELRKFFGDAICSTQGIYAASAQLRHSTIQMTSNHYTNRTQRAVLPFGSVMSESTPKALKKPRKKRAA